MITIKHRGNFEKTDRFLKRMARHEIMNVLDEFGKMGVEYLAERTPKETGKTANSWSYEVKRGFRKYSIIWSNSNVNDGVPIAVIIQYGHGTGNGGYVEGIDYINPAMKPVFKAIAEAVWKEVTK